LSHVTTHAEAGQVGRGHPAGAEWLSAGGQGCTGCARRRRWGWCGWRRWSKG